jgi:hypothetical protein
MASKNVFAFYAIWYILYLVFRVADTSLLLHKYFSHMISSSQNPRTICWYAVSSKNPQNRVIFGGFWRDFSRVGPSTCSLSKHSFHSHPIRQFLQGKPRKTPEINKIRLWLFVFFGDFRGFYEVLTDFFNKNCRVGLLLALVNCTG